MSVTQPPADLKRTIGVFGLACAVVNITVGTGIFVLPALVAEHLGAAAIICFFVCGFLIFLIALCFAEVGGKVTGSGGTYAYIETAFGPFAGFLANNIFLFGSCILADAAVANGLSETIGRFFPVADSILFRPIFFLILFGGLAFINIRGTKNGVKFVIFTTLAKLVPLLLIVIFGMSHISADNLQWKNPFTFNDIGSTSLILFFAFLGIESAVTSSGEFKNPSRVVPLGILSGISFVLILYISIQLVAQGMLGEKLLLYKASPLTEISRILFGYAGITLMTIGVAVSMLGTLSGTILAIPRVIFAGARNGIFPVFLGKIHSRYFTPHYSIIVYAALGYLLAVFGALKQLVILASASTLLIYLGVVLAVIKLRYRKTVSAEKTFTVPGGLLVPVLATIIIFWILSSLSKQEMIGISVTMFAFSMIYLLMKLYNRRKPLKNTWN